LKRADCEKIFEKNFSSCDVHFWIFLSEALFAKSAFELQLKVKNFRFCHKLDVKLPDGSCAGIFDV